MTARTRSVGTMPRDLHARERLREAQQTEARAVTAVCSAQVGLVGICRKRDEKVAAANATVTKAEHTLAAAQSNLVDISGLDRAAVLLGIDKASLRRAVATSATNSNGGKV